MHNVLALKPSSLGDIVHTLPAVARLKAARPDWRIAWLVNTEWAPLLVGNPDLAEVIPFPRRELRWTGLAPWVRGALWGRRPDLAVDFQGLLRTALLARLSRAKEVVGAADAREGAPLFYSRSLPALPGVPHAVERYLALADFIVGGKSAEPLRYPLPQGTLPAGVGEVDIVLHPFSRGAGKSLTVDQVADLCRMLAPRRVTVVGRAERPLPPIANVRDLLNATTLPELIGLLRRAAFVISVDSGPVHLAAALDRPLVSIHTWTDPRRVGPYRPDAWVWKGGQLFRMREVHAVPGEILTQPSAGPQSAGLAAIAHLALS